MIIQILQGFVKAFDIAILLERRTPVRLLLPLNDLHRVAMYAGYSVGPLDFDFLSGIHGG